MRLLFGKSFPPNQSSVRRASVVHPKHAEKSKSLVYDLTPKRVCRPQQSANINVNATLEIHRFGDAARWGSVCAVRAYRYITTLNYK